MNNNAKNKILMWAAVILLLANMATIAVFWKTRLQPPPPEAPASPASLLTAELNLDEAQAKAYMELVQEHRKAAEVLRRKLKNARDHFFDLVKEQHIADTTIMAAHADVSYCQQQLDMLTLQHFREVRALCNPVQQEKFDNTIHTIMQQIAGAPRPPGNAPGRPEGGPPPPAR